MIRIAFVAAATLAAAMSTASAGSDHYGADGVNQAATGADTNITASIPRHKTVKPAPKVDTEMKTGATGPANWPGPPSDNWGN
jgi:hypothetical protein